MYQLMLRFGSKILFEEYAQQYVIENGKTKFDKVADIVNSSDNINTYISNVISNNSRPNSDNIQYVLNTHNYFMFSKEETLCLGGLGIIIRWADLVFYGYNQEYEEEVTKIMSKLIDDSSRLKYNQFNSFFQRFQRSLALKLTQ